MWYILITHGDKKMSKFLDIVSGTEMRTQLGAWVRSSIGEMDRIVADGFPTVFGRNWQNKMSGFATSTRTKLLTYVFDYALEEMAERLGVKYAAANNEGRSETNHFDCYLFDYQVENKLSLGDSSSSFATGSSHNTENKVSRVLAVKIKSENYRSREIFACILDLEDAQSPSTGWIAGGGSGFSTLRVDLRDREIIVPICGNIATDRARNRRFVGVRYEPFRRDNPRGRIV